MEETGSKKSLSLQNSSITIIITKNFMTLPRFRRQDADNLCMDTGSLCIELFLESMGLVFKKTNNRSYEKNLGILKLLFETKMIIALGSKSY